MAAKALSREDVPTYDGDAAAWAMHQAELLLAGRFDELDRENLADEITDLAKREFSALTSALTILLVYLVKSDYQPWERSRSWFNSINECRRRILRKQRQNPSFRSRLDEALDDAWPGVVPHVLLDTKMHENEFPDDCPYDWDAITNRSVEWPLP